MEKNLYNVKNGKHYIILRVPDINLLSSIGLFRGAEILKEHTYGLGGPVSLSLSTRKIAIGKDIAKEIIVKEVD